MYSYLSDLIDNSDSDLINLMRSSEILIAAYVFFYTCI